MYREVGPACLTGLGFIIVLLPLQYYLGKYSAKFRQQLAKRTDERGRLMSEIIYGMRVIKQYAWETPFGSLVSKLRVLEEAEVKKRGILKGTHHAVFTFAPKLIQYMTFLLFVLGRDEPLTANKVFFTLTCLHTMIQITVHFTPLAAAGTGELLVAIKRIQNFLLLEEQPNNNIQRSYAFSKAMSIITEKESDSKNFIDSNEIPKVCLTNVTARWPESITPTLSNITTSIQGDKLVMIVGPVGSSKSSLLLSILQEIQLSSGAVSAQGTVTYASQEPWIFAGSIRQNILFGLPYDQNRYMSTIKACCLEEDIKNLPYGDLTVVGERGVTLSGGQKARVNLARALYKKPNIYLMDDPLAAVDARVSRNLFEKCIKDYLKGSIRVLVTHQLQYLPQADYIIVLNRGQILAQGNFHELLSAGVDFVKLLSADATEDLSTKRPSLAHIETESISPKNDAIPEDNQEQKASGSLTFHTYVNYFLAGHSKIGFVILVIAFVVSQISASSNDYWLSYWTNAEADYKNCSNVDSTTDREHCNGYLEKNIYLYVYTALVSLVTICSLWRGLWFYQYCSKTGTQLHNQMFHSIVKAPMKFFDENPSGRIMKRFTKDICTVDELLPTTVLNTFSILLQVIGVVAVVIISNYYMAIPTVVLFGVMIISRQIFIRTARDVKRLESVARSPIFSHVAASNHGLPTIRASGAQEMLKKQFESLQDAHSSAWFAFIGINRCFGMWLEIISDIFLVLVTFSFLLVSSSTKEGNVGLAISSLLSIMGTFQWGMRQSAEMENYMTSVERILEYADVTPEDDSQPSIILPEDWPSHGKIEFLNVSLSYYDDNPVLDNLSFVIPPFKKIGIVGRTGAGKSSIITTLFRLAEPQGKIFIDGLSIKAIPLQELRKRISLIPQDPVLFTGNIRFNLDPFNQYSDDTLWNVIRQVELADVISSLDALVEDSGTNFSVGQRQLICLARAILRKNKILVMDEPTASVDMKTDLLLQKTIREKFRNCTIITIAHRLHSIVDYDNVLVLDNGQIIEYDHPFKLLDTDTGYLKKMAKQTGKSRSAALKKISETAYKGI